MIARQTEAPDEPIGDRLLRRSIDGILLLLIMFTPLAFGSVEPWSMGVIHIACTLVFLLWCWQGLGPRAAQSQEGVWVRSLRPLREAGVLLPLGLFLVLVAVQLVPLPPTVLRWVSPTTHKLYKTTLPFYGTPEGVNFQRIESWLLDRGDSARTELEAPWGASALEDLRFSSWRPLSLVPASSRRNLGLLLSYLLAFIVVADRARDAVFYRRLLWTVACSGVLVAMLGLAQKTTWGDRLYGRIRPAYGGTPLGPFVNPNHFAGYLELAVPVLAGLWVALARRERNDKARPRRPAAESPGQSFVPQLFMLSVIVVIGFFAIWSSRSRGGLLSLASALVLFALTAVWRRRAAGRWRLPIALAVLLVLGMGVAWKVRAISVQESLAPELSTEPSLGKRLRVWQASADMLLKFPLTGTGLATYGYAIPLYQGGGYDRLWIYAHNDYVQLASETGLLGAALFLIGLVRLLRRVLARVVRDPLRWGGAVMGCAVGVVSILLHSLVDFNLQIPSNALLFVFLGAVLVARTAETPPMPVLPADKVLVPPRRRMAVGALATSIWLGFAVYIGAQIVARYWQNRATAEYWRGDLEEARRRLEKAARVALASPDLQADLGSFYLRALDEWNTAGKELGVGREEALKRARAALCRALNLNPINTFYWSGLAELYAEARAALLLSAPYDLSRLLDSDPARERLEQLQLAVVSRMIRLEPRNPYHQARRGDLYWEVPNKEAALRAYETAVLLLPLVDAHPFLSGSGTHPDILDAAVRGAEQAIAENRSGIAEHEMRLNASLLYEKRGDLRTAIQHMERAFDLFPRKDWYRMRLGYLCYNVGDLERSRGLLQEAIERGTPSEYPYIYLAKIARSQGDLEGAAKYLRKALSVNSENGRVALDLANLYDEIGDQRSAHRYYEMAIELMPSDVNTLLTVVEYYSRRGLSAQAVPLLEKVMALRPHDDVYRRRLEQLRERAGLLR